MSADATPQRSAARGPWQDVEDLLAEALRDRLARGHVYPADQVEAALTGWSQTGNLSALRELAVLWLAALRPAASIRSRVIRRGGGLDVHIVTCQRRPGPTQAHGPATAWWAT